MFVPTADWQQLKQVLAGDSATVRWHSQEIPGEYQVFCSGYSLTPEASVLREHERFANQQNPYNAWPLYLKYRLALPITLDLLLIKYCYFANRLANECYSDAMSESTKYVCQRSYTAELKYSEFSRPWKELCINRRSLQRPWNGLCVHSFSIFSALLDVFGAGTGQWV